MQVKAFSLSIIAALWAAEAGPVMAAPEVQLQFPVQAEETGQRQEPMGSATIALGPYAKGAMTTAQAEGRLQQVAWRLNLPRASTLELLNDLRGQIIAAGFAPRFECETDACGGFDFRFGIDILPEPDMHVDLGDFRYLAAERDGAAGKEYLALLVSKSPQQGHVQLTQIGPQTAVGAQDQPDMLLAAARKTPIVAQQQVLTLRANPNTPMAAQLDLGQSLVLEDLVFDSGSASLSAGDYASLAQLADWLRANPDRSVTLVGHTDASGGLAANVALSKQRAESVRAVMVQTYGLPPAAIAANGVGPLAPRASNLDEAGRQKNRRVEVLPTSTK